MILILHKSKCSIEKGNQAKYSAGYTAIAKWLFAESKCMF